MTHNTVLRGLAAALLTVALVVPYAHPVYCAMSAHDQAGNAQAVMAVPHPHSASHHSQPCHDKASCGVVSVAPVLASGTMLPTPTALPFDASAATGILIDTPTAPNTPPPRF